MGVANVAIKEAVASILHQKAGIAEAFSGATGPVQKLQELLTRVRLSWGGEEGQNLGRFPDFSPCDPFLSH